jgi:tetratricopeptide (TPR) repeat protein
MYERALELNDQDYAVWSNIAWMYKTLPNGQEKATSAYRRAIALAERSLAINPNDAQLICHLADCYWQTGARNKSLYLARQAMQLAPGDAEVMIRVGIIYEESGQRDEALQLICKAVSKGRLVSQIQETEELRELVSDPRFDSILNAKRQEF